MTRASADQQPTAASRGETTSARQDGPAPDEKLADQESTSPRLPHEHDESRHSQASATPQHGPVGRKAFEDATGPQADTDKGPVMDQVYNEAVAPGARK